MKTAECKLNNLFIFVFSPLKTPKACNFKFLNAHLDLALFLPFLHLIYKLILQIIRTNDKTKITKLNCLNYFFFFFGKLSFHDNFINK